MKFAKLFAALAVVALLALWATPAHAQEPAITIDPTSVEAAGSADVTVVATGFPADTSLFLLSCPGAEGDASVITEDNATTMCDIANMSTPTSDADGGFTETITVDVPEAGLVILAADQGTGAQASAVVTVGAAEAEAEATPEATPEATEEATATETATTTEEMPTTGGESGMLAIIGASIVIGGFLFVGLGRRMGRI